MICFVVSALLFQYQADPVRANEIAQAVYHAQASAQKTQRERQLSSETQDFEVRFNALTRALDDFMKVYNDGRGQVWPRKEAAALEKAMAEVQRTSTWKQGHSARKSD